MEDDRGVWRAGVVELTGQQVESDTEWFAGNFPEHLTTLQYLQLSARVLVLFCILFHSPQQCLIPEMALEKRRELFQNYLNELQCKSPVRI